MNKVYIYKIPTPPSVNALWRISGRRMYRSKKYMDWLREVEIALASEPKPDINYNFNIEIVVGRPRRKDGSISTRKSDIDNKVKGVLDSFQHLGIIREDYLANRVSVMWSIDIEDCLVTISAADVAM